jgi:hypothetical protein
MGLHLGELPKSLLLLTYQPTRPNPGIRLAGQRVWSWVRLHLKLLVYNRARPTLLSSEPAQVPRSDALHGSVL